MAILRTLWELVSLRLRWELAFRTDAFLGFLASSLYVAGGVLLFEVIYGQVGSIAGWGRAAALVLVGTVSLLLELERGLLSGLRQLPRLVRDGALDHYLLRPTPAPLLLAFRNVSPQLIWRLPLGLAVVAYGLTLAPPPAERVLLYCLSFLLSQCIYAMMMFCLVCLSFWLVEMNNLFWVIYDLMEFARYPATVYKGVFLVLLSTVLPLLMLANAPVQLLMRGASPALLLQQLLVLAGYSATGWMMWQKGLRRYQGTG